jgi:hypothetical protein
LEILGTGTGGIVVGGLPDCQPVEPFVDVIGACRLATRLSARLSGGVQFVAACLNGATREADFSTLFTAE